MDLFRRAQPANVVLFVAFALAAVLVWTGVWQLVFLAGYVAGFLAKRPRRAVSLGFLGGAFGWGAHVAWFYLERPGGALASLFAEILGLAGAGIAVALITVLIGGLVAGLGGLVGAYAGQLAYPPSPGSASAE